jgi:hypothetical protein
MKTNIKWILVLGFLLSIGLIAEAAQLNQIYMPVVYINNPTPTSTPTPTKTPNPTRTPRPTSTPAPGQCLSGKTSGLCITIIDYQPKSGGSLNEYIGIKNLGSSAVDLENWRIVNDKSEKFDIPKYSLNSNITVKIWTKTGTNDSSNLYMDRTVEFWNDVTDCAYLRDDSKPRKTIDAICYGLNGLLFIPILDEAP